MAKKLALKRKDFLTLLASAKTKKRRNALIDYADKDDILAICECITNALRGNIKLTPAKIKRLKRHKECLRVLSKTGVSLKKRKAALKQNGGFLPLLIPAAVSAISSLLGGIR